MVEDMHIGQKHVGKVPEQSLASQNIAVTRLPHALTQAIESEAYEDAANRINQSL